jgi:hypothetical protein
LSGVLLAAVACADATRPRLPAIDVVYPLLDARADPAVAQLADGRIFIAGGGLQDGSLLATAEVIDPSTGTSHHAACPLHIPRRRAVAVTLADGRVLILGGDTGNLLMLLQTELYDPATECFTDGPVMLERRASIGTAVRLQDGRVLVVKGAPLVRPPPAGGAELYDPAKNAFTLIDRDLGKETDVGAVAQLSDGHVLLVGGDEVPAPGPTAIPSDRVVLFDPVTSACTELATRLSLAREDMALAPDDQGGALVVGGGTGIATDLVERYDGVSRRIAAAGHLTVPRLRARALWVDGWTLVIGGKQAFGQPPLATTEWLSPSGDRGGAGPALAQGAGIGQHAFLLADGRVAVLRTAGDPPNPWSAALMVSSR